MERIEGVEWPKKRDEATTLGRRPQCARALALTTNGTGSVEGVGSWGSFGASWRDRESGDGLRRAWGGKKQRRTVLSQSFSPRPDTQSRATLLVVVVVVVVVVFVFAFAFAFVFVVRDSNSFRSLSSPPFYLANPFEWLPRASPENFPEIVDTFILLLLLLLLLSSVSPLLPPLPLNVTRLHAVLLGEYLLLYFLFANFSLFFLFLYFFLYFSSHPRLKRSAK